MIHHVCFCSLLECSTGVSLVEIDALLQLFLLLQSIIQASVRNMAEGGASGPPDLISGMVQPVDLVNSVTR